MFSIRNIDRPDICLTEMSDEFFPPVFYDFLCIREYMRKNPSGVNVLTDNKKSDLLVFNPSCYNRPMYLV